jgi:dTDP-4-dehydrorhamnose reductase
MKVLILGGDGMLGHKLLATLSPDHVVAVTLRQPLPAYEPFGLFNPGNVFPDFDARSAERAVELFARFRPDAVVNCIGIVKQRDEAKDVVASIEINALLPHRLAELCGAAGARLIHIGTDCVFSGRRGGYREADISDAEDLYGRTKYLGEVATPPALTLRTSIIGRELSRKRSLVEWFLAQTGGVRGFRRAIFNGLTTAELSRVIKMVLERFPEAHGLYHVSAEPIDKFSLLHLLREHYRKEIDIAPDETVVIDRSLDSTRFRTEFAYRPPNWPEMIAGLTEPWTAQ